MTQPTSAGIGAMCVRPRSRSLSPGIRLALVGMVAAIGLAGCAGTASNSTATATTTSASTSSTDIPSPTPAPSPTAAPPLSFVATGSMQIARLDATATLLKNGKVLIAGGAKGLGMTDTILAEAELYDPATGKFTFTGSMTAARLSAAATLLSDGRVLIAGGNGCSEPKLCTNGSFGGGEERLASAEIYDPATGKFTATGSMGSPSWSGNATLLPDGRVLVSGPDFPPELYDPTTGKFGATGQSVDIKSPVTSTLLPNGKVLLTGYAASPQLYDEGSGKFTDISITLPAGTPEATYDNHSVPRSGTLVTGTLLPDGRVLLYDNGYLETYDSATGICADAGFISPSGEWDWPTATLLADGSVLYQGGAYVARDKTGTYAQAAVLYSPTASQYRKGHTQEARGGETATLLADGSVLIAGGEDADSKALASAELFKP